MTTTTTTRLITGGLLRVAELLQFIVYSVNQFRDEKCIAVGHQPTGMMNDGQKAFCQVSKGSAPVTDD